MDWKSFFKPTIEKIVFFTIIFIMSCLGTLTLPDLILRKNIFCLECPDSFYIKRAIGLPIPFYSSGSNELGGQGFSYLEYKFLIFDIIFWYLVSCLILRFYEKNEKKK